MYHLDIPKTRQYDHGKVEVIARSSLGESRCETTLTVKPRSDDYRGVLKNSPRRKYSSPWGPCNWNTENLVDPPQFFKYPSTQQSKVYIKELEVKTQQNQRYKACLYFNAENLSSKISSVERRSHFTWEHLNEYAHKSTKTIKHSTSFKSVKDIKLQQTLSIRHIHSIREQDESETEIPTDPIPHHTCPITQAPVVVVPAASSPSEASSSSLVIEIPSYEQKKPLACYEALRFTHSTRKELLEVWNTTKIVR